MGSVGLLVLCYLPYVANSDLEMAASMEVGWGGMAPGADVET